MNLMERVIDLINKIRSGGKLGIGHEEDAVLRAKIELLKAVKLVLRASCSGIELETAGEISIVKAGDLRKIADSKGQKLAELRAEAEKTLREITDLEVEAARIASAVALLKEVK